MSHIPASAMPHAHAHGDTIDDQPPKAAGDDQPPKAAGDDQPTKAGSGRSAKADDGDRSAPSSEATAGSSAPLSSPAPGTATGNRKGSQADRTARSAGEPDATARNAGQPPVGDDEERPARRGFRSPAGIAALALGGLALAGGVAAMLFPRGEAKPKSKAKKSRRKKS